MNTSRSISVVVPVHDGAALLVETLSAIRANASTGFAIELIVVDDASSDGSGRVAAEWADRVVELGPAPRGPGYARNAGAALAKGDWLLFVDADVRLHADTLDRLNMALNANSAAVAVFGAYDDSPPAPGLVSQFRNLLHHRVHAGAPGPADTFWAGLGAVRRDVFLAAGGFDAARFPGPSIEDIDLGYRLADAGGRIVLDPSIQGAHLKRWTLGTMVRTDWSARGVPWMRLLLERGGRTRPSLAVGGSEPVKVALAAIGSTAAVIAMIPAGHQGVFGALAALAMAGLVALNAPLLTWFGRRRGSPFALATIPLIALFYVVAAGAGLGGLLAFAAAGFRPRPVGPN